MSSGTVAARRAPSRSRAALGRLAIQVVSFVLLLLAWELYAGGINRALLAPPSEIVAAAHELVFLEPVLWNALVTSMTTLAVGFALAVPAGIAAGVLLGRIRLLELVAEPYVWFLYALPSIALIPVLVIWFGIGVELRTFMVFEAGFFPMLIYTMAGVKETDRELLDVGRAFGASERQIATTVVLPSAIPLIFSGIRISLGACLIAVVVVEMVVLITGLGGLVVTYANSFQTDELFVPIIAIMLVSIALTQIAAAVQRRITPWTRVELEGL